MKVSKLIEDFEKDLVTIEVDMTIEEQKFLIEKGFNQLLNEYVEKTKQEYNDDND